MSETRIIIEKPGNETEAGLRPYNVCLREQRGEYVVSRRYTDDAGGYGNGSYYRFGASQQSALLAAVNKFVESF